MICAGLEQMLSEHWDSCKTFVIGIAIIFGLSTSFLPPLYARSPKIIQTFFTDPLPTTTILAVILNQIFGLDKSYKKIRDKFKTQKIFATNTENGGK
jgi:NCS2 family nucleobase:cation symporter-2